MVSIVRELGYIGLYFWLWFGAFAIPIPNEVIVSAIGFFASENVLIPWRLFIVTYFGILAAVTTSYLLGRFAGRTVLLFFKKRSKSQRKFERAHLLIEKHNFFALAFSYFVPGLRIIIPFLFGFSKLSFLKFVAILYPAIFIWVSMIFSVGFFAGEEFIKVFLKYYDIVIAGLVGLAVIYIMIKIKRMRNVRRLSH